MTWPANATRAEILRILEINAHIFIKWEISREETEAVLAVLGASEAALISARAHADEIRVVAKEQRHRADEAEAKLATRDAAREPALGGTRQVPRATRFYGDEGAEREETIVEAPPQCIALQKGGPVDHRVDMRTGACTCGFYDGSLRAGGT